MIKCGGGARRYRESRLGKGLGLLPEIIEEVAALKVLQPVPRCPDRKRPLFRNQVDFRPRSGWVPEEASSRRISGHVTGMALPLGIREVPKEMTVGSSIGPTASGLTA